MKYILYLVTMLMLGGVTSSTDYEDFTTAAEVDNGSMLTVTADAITFDYTDNSDNYVYWDAGAGYFSGSFEVQFVVNITSGDNILVNLALSNTLNDSRAMDTANDGAMVKIQGDDDAFFMGMYDLNGSLMSSSTIDLSLSTPYYCTWIRDEDVAGNYGYGVMYIYVYSDAERTILVDSESLSPKAANDYRYMYPFVGYNMGETDNIAGTISNFSVISPALP